MSTNNKNGKNGNDEIDADQYRTEVAQAIVQEIFNLLHEEEKRFGVQFREELSMTILSSLIANFVYRSLQPPTESQPIANDLPSAEALVMAQYNVTKQAIENSIASGFTGGFLAFDSAQVADFLCKVHAIGQPVNKLPA